MNAAALWWEIPGLATLGGALVLSAKQKWESLGALAVVALVFWLGYLCCWVPGHVEVSVK